MPLRVARIEERRVSDLKTHPCWANMLGSLSASRMEAFTEDVSAYGVRQRIEILPDNTIIFGELRKQAVRQRGVTYVSVLVRYDLADQPAGEIEYSILSGELNRRHLKSLGEARLVHRLCELEAQRTMPEGGWEAAVKAAAKDKIAMRLGITLRSVNTYLRAIKAPLEVQNACERGEITLATVGRVAQLDRMTRNRISRRIRAGRHAAVVVADYLLPRTDTLSGAVALGRWLRSLKFYVPLLRSYLRDLAPEQLYANRHILGRAGSLVTDLLARAEYVDG